MLTWLIVMIAMIAVELVTLGNLVSIWFAIGALFALVTAFITENLLIQTIVFAIVSVLSLILVRPMVNRTLRGRMISTNADSIIGRKFELTDEITFDSWGMIMVDGSPWSAVSYDHKPIVRGVLVEVVAIAGVKLVVKQIGGNE